MSKDGIELTQEVTTDARTRDLVPDDRVSYYDTKVEEFGRRGCGRGGRRWGDEDDEVNSSSLGCTTSKTFNPRMGRTGADQWADTEDVRSVCSECVTVKYRTEGDTDFRCLEGLKSRIYVRH